MLEIKNLHVDIQNINILSDLNLKVKKFSSIIGRNGAGKTTLMRSIIGVLKIRKGSIIFEDKNLTNTNSHLMSKLGIGYMPEDRRLVPELNVRENILTPVWLLKNKTSEKQELDRVLEFIPEIKNFLDRSSFQLSGGQQKLVSLARAMIVGKKLLLLDEPFEGVAPALADRLVELIKSLSKLNLIALITESDETYSKKINSEIIRIERGKIL
ncbi:MAG: ABC transporter ATP-binding protein [Rickettsiales bacterium]|nr:ABC transporter ATP-binding protein [Rickettsiales bacterium]|tara:strand:+ start:246 stop:881 length:636 start_codon:yes stop_codon:yes gene_type:complete